MKRATATLKNLLLPQLEKDSSFEMRKLSESFLESFVSALCDYEKDVNPVYELLHHLELNNTEKIITKLDTLYTAFIKEMAEDYVLGHSTEISTLLLETKNPTFEKEVLFFTHLRNAIVKAERKRIKQELPNTYEKLNFKLSDDTITNVIKKKEREALKQKMKVWDEELQVAEQPPVYSMETNFKRETKVITLSWMKYAVAACLVLGIGVWFYNYNNQGTVPDTNVVTAPKVKDTIPKNTSISKIPEQVLAEVTTVTKNTSVLESGLGFGANKIRVIEHNQKARIASIVKAIENYQKMLEKEYSKNSVGDNERTKVLKDSIISLQKELAALKAKEQHYEFDGKSLVLYVSDDAIENAIVYFENNFYLKKKTVFYKLAIAKQPQAYEQEHNSKVIDALNKIYDGY